MPWACINNYNNLFFILTSHNKARAQSAIGIPGEAGNVSQGYICDTAGSYVTGDTSWNMPTWNTINVHWYKSLLKYVSSTLGNLVRRKSVPCHSRSGYVIRKRRTYYMMYYAYIYRIHVLQERDIKTHKN